MHALQTARTPYAECPPHAMSVSGDFPLFQRACQPCRALLPQGDSPKGERSCPIRKYSARIR